MATTDLSTLVQSLPTELYDQIYDLTFSVEATHSSAPRTVNITKSYRPPLVLQINRRIRESFAIEFYSSSHFYCSKDDAVKWLRSLPKGHIEMIQRIRIVKFFYEAAPAGILQWRVVREFGDAMCDIQRPMWFIDMVFEFEDVNGRDNGDRWIPALHCRLD